MKTKTNGFTRVELLVVIVLASILVAIVVVSLNPSRQFAQSRNAQRLEDVNAILDAVARRLSDTNNAWNTTGYPGYDVDCESLPVPGVVTPISEAGFNMHACIVPSYAPRLVSDPSVSDIANPPQPLWDSGYTLERTPNGRIIVSAPYAELGEIISVTR